MAATETNPSLASAALIHPDRLRGRVYGITGGSRGIGRSAAIRVVQEGASDVILLSRNPADEVLAEIDSLGGRGFWVKCDLADEPSIRQASKDILGVIEKIGKGMDGWVNNAGITEEELGASRVLSMDTIRHADTQRMFDVNLFGPKWLTTLLLREDPFDHTDGKIPSFVNMASVRGRFYTMMGADYDMTKAGMITWTRGLTSTVRHDFGYEIRANAVCPGFIETDETINIPPLLKEIIRFLTPMKRFGKPEEVAGIIAHYLSDDTKFVTGSDYSIDGGLANIVSAAAMIYEERSEFLRLLQQK